MKAAHLSTENAPAEASAAGAPSGMRLLGFLGFILLLSLAFGGSLVSLIAYASETSLHSHILLVPFVSGYLIYLQRGILPKSWQCSAEWAALALAIGLAAADAAWRLRTALGEGDYLSIVAFSFVTLILAGGFLFLGRKWMSAAIFPVAFLYFFVPLPDAAVEWMETALKLGSAEAASLFFSISGMPVFRDGVVFQLPGITLEVAQECSGIHSSWVLLITSIVASHLLLKSPWRRAVLLAVVIPLAILRNGFRILVIGLLCVQIGPQMIHSAIHHHGGPLFFALSLVPLFLLLWWLRSGEESKTPSDNKIQ